MGHLLFLSKGMTMTDTAVETPVAENAEVENVEAPESTEPPILASLSEADAVTQATVPVAITLINAFNEIATRNSSKTKGVDEIAADLAETSQDPKVVALRQKRDEIQEQISKAVLDQAKAIKAESGEPDLDAEKAAHKAMKGVLDALSTFPDGKRVQHFLPEVVKGTATRSLTGSAGASGPKNDLSAVREWARKNGFEVKDRGRMPDEVLDAYNKAHASK